MPYQTNLFVKAVLTGVALANSGIPYAETTPINNISTERYYQIAPQSLALALKTFSKESDLQLFYQAELVKQQTSPELKGYYTPEQALKQLLENSRLNYRVKNANTITLEKRVESGFSTEGLLAAAGDFVLAAAEPEDEYTGPVEQEDLTVSGRELNGYNVINASTATKTDTPIFDTPVAIQVVPKSVMDDQQAVTLVDAIRNVSGVIQGAQSSGEAFEEFVIRGFNNGFSTYRDGFKIDSVRIPVFNAEKVEVLKGPAAMLFGRIEPGGLINVTTKRPQAESYHSLQQQFGSYDLYRTTLDSTGSLNSDDSLLYRLNFEYMDKNTFRDFVSTERVAVAPSLTWKVDDKTQVDLDFMYTDEDVVNDNGLVAIGDRPASIPISRFLGEPSEDDGYIKFYQAGMTINHQITDDWQVKGRYTYSRRESVTDGTSIGSVNESTGVATRNFFRGEDVKQDIHFGNLDITGHFDTWSLEHTLLLGADFFRDDFPTRSRFLTQGFTTSFPAPININNPVYGQPGVNLAQEPLNSFFFGSKEWYGIYLQDQIALGDKWQLLLGGRFDSVTRKVSFSEDRKIGIIANDDAFSPRVGLLYHPLPWLSLYGNYVEGMGNSNEFGVTTSGTVPDPQEAEQFEVGLKGEWFDGDLSASLAFYELTKTNITTPIVGTNFVDLSGEAQSRGVEFDFSGQLTEYLRLIGNYAYTDTEVTKDRDGSGGNGKQGNWLPNAPRHSGSVWANYDFSGLGAQGLSSGAGVFLVGKRQGDSANTFQLPGYGRVDAMLKYQRAVGPSNVTLQFNVQNLLDKRHFISSGGFNRNLITPGAPRTFMGSVKVEF